MNDLIKPELFTQIQSMPLRRGSHGENDDLHMCVMEAVSYIAGEPWSDAPQCACPVITTFMVSWNDSLPSNEERDRLLKPLIPLIVGTRSTKAVEEKRSYMALDWLIRVYTPKWLDMVPALHHDAKALRELDAIVDIAGATAAGAKVRIAASEASSARDAARDAAGDAAWAAVRDAAGYAAGDAAWVAVRDAAGDAAGDAAWDAVRDAAGDAAWVAAGAAAGDAARAAARDAAWAAAGAAAWAAAGAAAWAAAGDAAWAAAGDAAWAAAGAALKPTTQWLQAGAAELVKNMCEVKA
jgi:hypothetical protein